MAGQSHGDRKLHQSETIGHFHGVVAVPQISHPLRQSGVLIARSGCKQAIGPDRTKIVWRG
jgi:hypothetical protein